MFDHVIDHSLQAHAPAIVRRINPGDSISHKVLDLFGKDHTASATKDLDMRSSFFLKQVIHVFEILIMTSLIRGHGYGICIFLNSSIDYLFNTSVMAKMNYLYSCRLDNSSHNIDSGIVSVEK